MLNLIIPIALGVIKHVYENLLKQALQVIRKHIYEVVVLKHSIIRMNMDKDERDEKEIMKCPYTLKDIQDERKHVYEVVILEFLSNNKCRAYKRKRKTYFGYTIYTNSEKIPEDVSYILSMDLLGSIELELTFEHNASFTIPFPNP